MILVLRDGESFLSDQRCCSLRLPFSFKHRGELTHDADIAFTLLQPRN